MKKHIIFLFTLSQFVVVNLYSQNQGVGYTAKFIPGRQYEITMKNESVVKGVLVNDDKQTIYLKDNEKDDEYEINKSDIVWVKQILSANDLKPPYHRAFIRSYILADNALPYEKGASLTGHYFLFNNITYAFNEHWAFSGNMLLVLPVSMGIKCSYKLAGDIFFGGSAYLYGVPMRDSLRNKSYYSLPLMGSMLRLTKGNEFRNFTFGAGIHGIKEPDPGGAYIMSNWKYLQAINVFFALNHQFSKSFSVVAESRLFPQIMLNTTGAGIKIIKPNTEWNFSIYGLYLGKTTQLNSKSSILPLPYISYSLRI